jgi:hypothetical protein
MFFTPFKLFTFAVLIAASFFNLACGRNADVIASVASPSPKVEQTTVTNSHSETPRSDLDIKKAVLKLGDTDITVVSSTSNSPGPLYFRPHEDETTAHDAVLQVMAKRGGRFVELQSKGTRLIDFLIGRTAFRIDPNRIFTNAGTRKTLEANGATSAAAINTVTAFAQRLLNEYLKDSLIIAVHNNTDGKPLSVNTYVGSNEVVDTFVNPARDEDDFFLCTQQAHFQALKARGFNVVLQNSSTVVDDGSLSVYCGSKGIAYINVEAQRGHLAEQVEMLNALGDILSQK